MLIGLLSHYFFGISLFVTSLFLILLVLVQRGRGGGIAGALGGAGGQSAFGTKAGDLFTRITVGVATFWILLCCAAIIVLKGQSFTTGVSSRDVRTGTVTGVGESAGIIGDEISTESQLPSNQSSGVTGEPTVDSNDPTDAEPASEPSNPE
jgi:preprotein translocase subunit SecG